MGPMKTFLFLAMQQPEPTARLIRASARVSATVLLDLEDALWDVTDEARTSALKAAGREDLVTLARAHPDFFERRPIGVRINRVSGPEAERDFEALGRASRFVEFECLVLPKLETERDLTDCRAAIRTHKVACRSIVPIVETRRAMANLRELLAAVRRAGIEWVVYGHYDLGLDSGWWPFSEHNEPAFWDRAEPVIADIEAAGLGYVHPPYFHIHDDAGLALILERLRRVCRREFGILTIGLRQASLADPGVRLRPHIVRDFHMDLSTRLDRLLAEQPVDGVLVHLRVPSIVTPVGVFARASGHGRNRYRLNPALVRRGHPNRAARWRPSSAGSGRMKLRGTDAWGDEPDLQDQRPSGIRSLNVALGTLVGLGQWAVDEQQYEFDQVERACRERGLPLFVLGPTPAPYSYWANRIVREANATIRRRLSDTNVPFVLVEQVCDREGRPLTRTDGVHLTVDGHRYVAQLLHGHGMSEWVSEIVSVKRQLGRRLDAPS
jgi:citrate lyase beta subunit